MYLNFVVNYFFLLICQCVDQLQLDIKTSTEAGHIPLSAFLHPALAFLSRPRPDQ